MNVLIISISTLIILNVCDNYSVSFSEWFILGSLLESTILKPWDLNTYIADIKQHPVESYVPTQNW